MPDAVVIVERVRCGHSSRLGAARVAEGEPHVLAHHTARTLPELAASLASDGYTFEVQIEDREVSIMDWFATGGRHG
jgi:hypothetical protein